LTRIFSVFLLFLLCAELYAAGDDAGGETDYQPLKALISVDREKVRENSPFLLVMQVNHSEPLEVDLVPPDFGEYCTLDMVRSTMYIRSGSGDDAEKWTEFELFITPKAAGKLFLEPFTISTPDQSIWTQPIELDVLPAEQEGVPQLVWGGVKNIQQGGSGEVYLQITGTGGGRTPPGNLPVNIAAVKNAIIEPIGLTGDDKYSGVVFRVRVTPLDGKTVNLAPTQVNYEKRTLVVPALNIRVFSASQKPQPQPTESKNSPSELAASFLQADRQESRAAPPKPPFPPDFAGKKSFRTVLSGGFFLITAARAAKFWDEGNYAAALAVLRKGEQDSIAGKDFAALRKLCEKSLDIPVTVNEQWRPPVLFWAFGLLALLFIFVRLVVFIFVRDDASRRFPRFGITIAVLIVVLCGALLADKKFNSGGRAVARKGCYYNVPEKTDTRAGGFEDGIPLRITTKSGAWLYAASEDGAGGWLPRENVVLY
jgi:hypothetical protein